jgi:hypothetical protein
MHGMENIRLVLPSLRSSNNFGDPRLASTLQNLRFYAKFRDAKILIATTKNQEMFRQSINEELALRAKSSKSWPALQGRSSILVHWSTLQRTRAI